jgi:hypothetical protein
MHPERPLRKEQHEPPDPCIERGSDPGSQPARGRRRQAYPSVTVPGVPTGPAVARSTQAELKALTVPGATAKFPATFTLTDDGKNKGCVVAMDWGDGNTDPTAVVSCLGGAQATIQVQ